MAVSWNWFACLEVETVRLDEYETRHPMRVDLIKIDVEDFEANVLEGMQKIIMRDRPFIVCEVLPRLHRNQRICKIVEALNYQTLLDHARGLYQGSQVRFRSWQFHRFPAVTRPPHCPRQS